eukprot:TRINITY_DN11474_c0_g1_i1.p1 TRINITY_DN11474_c0_g1~~TRINITY_DN11474_c0_g1_i1.p1  ORF type:complete len:390 (+),score=41.12 TRINITY_DN11474_c0_g1_i1:136-1170(+)
MVAYGLLSVGLKFYFKPNTRSTLRFCIFFIGFRVLRVVGTQAFISSSYHFPASNDSMRVTLAAVINVMLLTAGHIIQIGFPDVWSVALVQFPTMFSEVYSNLALLKCETELNKVQRYLQTAMQWWSKKTQKDCPQSVDTAVDPGGSIGQQDCPKSADTAVNAGDDIRPQDCRQSVATTFDPVEEMRQQAWPSEGADGSPGTRRLQQQDKQVFGSLVALSNLVEMSTLGLVTVWYMVCSVNLNERGGEPHSIRDVVARSSVVWLFEICGDFLTAAFGEAVARNTDGRESRASVLRAQRELGSYEVAITSLLCAAAASVFLCKVIHQLCVAVSSGGTDTLMLTLCS